jgi:hypothetical protein
MEESLRSIIAVAWGIGQVPEGRTYASLEDYVLDRGTWYQSQELTERELSIVLDAARRAGDNFARRHCFANAARLVLSDSSNELVYVEGYAHGAALPIHHAWAVIRGKVVDLTCRRHDNLIVMEHRYSDRVLGAFPPEQAYIGISFSRKRVMEKLTRSQNNLSFLSDLAQQQAMFSESRRTQPPATERATDHG